MYNGNHDENKDDDGFSLQINNDDENPPNAIKSLTNTRKTSFDEC